MKSWIGKAVILIGIIHTLFGFIYLRHIFLDLWQDGLLNTVNGQLDREAFFWFTMGGFFMIALGLIINWVEQQQVGFPNLVGWILLTLTLVVVLIMPISGGWLLFIPAIGALSRGRKSRLTTE